MFVHTYSCMIHQLTYKKYMHTHTLVRELSPSIFYNHPRAVARVYVYMYELVCMYVCMYVCMHMYYIIYIYVV